MEAEEEKVRLARNEFSPQELPRPSRQSVETPLMTISPVPVLPMGRARNMLVC